MGTLPFILHSSQYSYDPLNRLTALLDALGHTTQFAYDARDNLVTVTDPKGVVIETNAYDLRNRITSRTDALTQATQYAYDATGNLTRITDRKGQATGLTYDAINRITRSATADGRTTDSTYDIAGNLIRISDSQTGEILYSYDSLNRLISETTDRGIVSYNYDALGRLTERRINGSDPTAYAYDQADRIKTITYRSQSVTYNYDLAGRLTSRALPNGITQSFAYDDANELLSLTYQKADNTIIETVSYSYDENGNRITRNRTQLGSVPETPFTATYDANNKMLTYNGNPLTYDANGNLITRQTPQGIVTYAWDAQNRLIGISGPNGTASFKYDARGRRIEKTINGATTAYLYDGLQAIAELQGSSIGTTYLTGLQIDEVLARYSNQGNRTLLTDALGSVLAQTDDSQTSQTIYGYSPYGETTEAGETGNPLQYTGRENDNTGLYFYRARYYDPQLKRFISEDPIGLDGGVNVYAYVDGNPLAETDPSGEVGVAGAAIGAGFDLALQLWRNGGNLSCVNWWEVAGAGAAGAVGDIAISKGLKALKALRAAKSVPNPGGRLGSPTTRGHIGQVAAELERRGFQITGGGGRLPEEFISGPGGGRLGSAFPDITAIKNGQTLRINTVDTLRNGITPTAREARNAAKIRSLRPEDHLLLIPKP